MRRTPVMASPSLLALRPAQSSDEAFLFRLYADSRRDELAGCGWPAAQQEIFLRSQFAARQSSYRAAFPAAKHAIILDRRKPVGGLITNCASDEIRVVDLILLPARRGAGLGGRLLRDLMEEARATNKPLRLQVLKHNPAARLYLRLGFTPTGETGFYLKMEWRTPLAAAPGT